MIGFVSGQEFGTKVWHNTKFHSLIPECPNISSKAHMINELVKCIENHGTKPGHQLFSEFLNNVDHNLYFHDFDQLKLGLSRYCRNFRIPLNNDFTYLKEKLGYKQRVIPESTNIESVNIVNFNPPRAVSYTHLTLPTICSV